ncbi:hypothetical protein [Asaccharospora irregularis]|uniref:Uncharacterized protein n=1 Tax=Asaccharospora irregularis DSM 2635 TaxID=1121321 RepID=A0A1M5N4K8_9FIRM|nr:hypothetical protein [Asaccharospora irregularis]SHG84372.1 hypothetical protein SAMN04488530_1092 [Asaccharospora irregularis DSM 2635]
MDNNLDQNNLDFEKMNAKLADSEFANWYYHKLEDNSEKDITITDFVNIVNNYESEEYK